MCTCFKDVMFSATSTGKRSVGWCPLTIGHFQNLTTRHSEKQCFQNVGSSYQFTILAFITSHLCTVFLVWELYPPPPPPQKKNMALLYMVGKGQTRLSPTFHPTSFGSTGFLDGAHFQSSHLPSWPLPMMRQWDRIWRNQNHPDLPEDLAAAKRTHFCSFFEKGLLHKIGGWESQDDLDQL